MEKLMENTIEIFKKYVQIDTQSQLGSETYPSTLKQLDLSKLLLTELQEMGVRSELRDGYLYAFIEPTITDKKGEVVAFIAHVDTALDLTGANVKPQVVTNYDGNDIKLNDKYTLSPRDFESLLQYKGKTLITTDGTTLLGADDKAGVTSIMEVIKYLMENPFPHYGAAFCFTPDEEIGQGTTYFDVDYLGADFGYTIDGSQIGEFEYENFNAAQATIDITGRSVHPGDSFGKMINASLLVNDIINRLPENRPNNTVEYEGFVHVINTSATCEYGTVSMIIRDHDKDKIAAYKQTITNIVKEVQEMYPGAQVKLEIKDQYFNMKEEVVKKPQVIDYALKAYEASGITPVVKPIRGGTDGSNLSFKGLVCPNIFTGGHNFHGRYEYVVVESMLKSQEVMINIIKEIAKGE